MPPVLTVTPNEIEQLIECVRSKPYLYHDAQRAYNDWKEIATEMEKEGIGLHRPPMDPYLSVLSFFSHVSCNIKLCLWSQASPDPQVRPVARGVGRPPPRKLPIPKILFHPLA